MSKKRIFVVMQTVLSLIAIIVIIGLTLFMLREKREDLNENNIQSSMLLIQGACKVLYEDSIMKKTTDNLIGTKISDAENADYINKSIIDKFKQTNTIEEGDYEKYYILTDTDLENINVYVRNEKDSYYIVGYEKDDIIITKGYNGKYKLSDIEKEDSDQKNENKSEEKQEEQKEEKKEEQQEESENKEEESEDNKEE